ncbi:ferritin-like domain-containing protein [Geomesophilobacter sediminis]|uniref:Ferritin family protein n=1 Tax=Geomesophilobacter sediminis TaxID=2798584 RepID=A0A8J7JMP3_9BACT|nr:ferritin family protein [Geomesophilobacter sediminis]MBJ6726035.1 ferritin family protein [Geomesophilobacter sediminis]
MTKHYTLQEALRLAIKSEKDSMDFYRKAAELVTDARSKEVFTLLAKEEVDHLKSFYGLYQWEDLGPIDAFIATPPDKLSATHLALEKAIAADTTEKVALEIALKEEKAGIELYQVLVQDITDQQVKHVFEAVIKGTQGHYDLIEDEYMRVMAMVHSSDQNIYVRE